MGSATAWLAKAGTLAGLVGTAILIAAFTVAAVADWAEASFRTPAYVIDGLRSLGETVDGVHSVEVDYIDESGEGPRPDEPVYAIFSLEGGLTQKATDAAVDQIERWFELDGNDDPVRIIVGNWDGDEIARFDSVELAAP